MDMARFESSLEQLGLTGQEARLYRALLEHGDLNGYEAARESGISRSNAYHALASLVDKGFADPIEGESVRYGAVSPEDVALLARRRVEDAIAAMLACAPSRRREQAPFLSVAGRDKVLERMSLLVDSARERVYLGCDTEDLEAIRGALAAAVARGIRVTVLANRAWALEGCVCLSRRKARGQVRLIVDGARVLTGELGAGSAACVLSENAHLVALIKDSLSNEIELVRVRTEGKDGTP